MVRKVSVFTICSIMMVCMALCSCGKKIEKVIEIKGARTMGPALTGLAESFNSKNNTAVTVALDGSLKGLALIVEGKCDIAASSVKIPAQQAWEAQKKGIALKEFVVAYDIILPVVHPSNPLKNLFLGQMADMYSGLIKDWKTVEIRPGKIIVVDRDDNSGTRLLMNEKFFEIKKVMDGSIKVKSDRDVAAYVAKHPEAIGYISKGRINSSIKAVSINGFGATRENIEKGYYPLYRELYIYVNEKNYSGAVKSFIDFTMSKNGQDMIEKYGLIPVARMNKPVK